MVVTNNWEKCRQAKNLSSWRADIDYHGSSLIRSVHSVNPVRWIIIRPGRHAGANKADVGGPVVGLFKIIENHILVIMGVSVELGGDGVFEPAEREQKSEPKIGKEAFDQSR